MASLVLYGSSVADAILTTACDMAAASGGTETSKTTTNNAGPGNFMECTSKGLSSVPSQTSLPAPTGNGWVYSTGAGTFAAGNWAVVITFACTTPSAGNSTVRFYRYSGGAYTSIGTIDFAPSSASKTTYSPAAVSMSSITFASGDLLYVDCWYQDNLGIGSDTCTVYESTSATAGVANDLVVTTSSFTASGGGTLSMNPWIMRGLQATFEYTNNMQPINPGPYVPRGLLSTLWERVSERALLSTIVEFPDDTGRYVPRGMLSTLIWSARQFKDIATRFRLGKLQDIVTRFLLANPVPLTVYPVNTISSTLATADLLVAYGTGTAGTGIDTAIGTATGYSEIFIHGTASAWQALGAIGNPSGNGSLYDVTVLEGKGILAGNWTPTIRTRINGGNGNLTADFYIRYYKYNAGTYTLIATVSQTGNTLTSVSATFTLPATALPPVPFGTGDKLYIDVWYNVTANANTLGAGKVRQDVATSVTIGETNAQFVTPGYAPMNQKDVATRFRLGKLNDITTRFRLMSANQLKDIVTRFRLAKLNDVASRFRLGKLNDIATRFRLMSANQLKDVATRFRLGKLNDITTRFRLAKLQDIATRFRLTSGGGTQSVRDIATRFNLARLQDIVTRFRLAKLNDIATRFRLMSANQLKDVSARLRLAKLQDIATRFRLAKLNDIATRFRLMSANQLKDVATRFRLMSANQLKDVATRFRLMSANQLKDVSARLRLAKLMDVATRFRLAKLNDIKTRLRLMSALQLKDVATRFRLMSAYQLKDVAARLRLGRLRDISCRFVLQSGQAPQFLSATWITRDLLIAWNTRDERAAWNTRDEKAGWSTRDTTDTWTARDENANWKTRGS